MKNRTVGLIAAAISLLVATYAYQQPTSDVQALCSPCDRYVEIDTPLYDLVYDTEVRGPLFIEYVVQRQELKLAGAQRNGKFWYPACKENLPPVEVFKNGFDRGHLIADRLSDGSQYRDWAWCMCAISPMHYRLNRGPFKALENRVYEMAQTRDVRVKIVLVYTSPDVPSEYIVEVEGEGQFVFPNVDPGQKKLEDFRCQST